jgi:predicted nucleotidyltransferase
MRALRLHQDVGGFAAVGGGEHGEVLGSSAGAVGGQADRALKAKSRPWLTIKLHLEPELPLLYIMYMRRDEVIARLKEAEPALRARGIRRAAVFGSVARGEDRPDSDIDIMIEIDPEAHITVYDYVGLKEFVAGLFEQPVHVANSNSLKSFVRPSATRDAIYAF